MLLIDTLTTKVIEGAKALFEADIPLEQISFQKTRKEFEGDTTLVVFPLVRFSKKSPEETANAIGNYLKEQVAEVEKFNVVKGFLNISFADTFWADWFASTVLDDNYGFAKPNSGKTVMVEYSSPNTNKPLHLGHIRNNLLGYSVAEILKANGHKVLKTQIINDRGIHICKSMLAWQKWGNGETPESSGLKGDKLVGKYYVEFDKRYKAEIAELEAKGQAKDDAEKNAPIIKEAQEMLRKWEAKDTEVYQLWETMNGWVYKGFDETYHKLGVDFDKLYYESDTYLVGKGEVLEGLEKGIFFKKDDGSVWVDLTADGLDEKLLLRADGTSVYMTQDIGTAILRYKDFPDLQQQVYTVGNEQEYHFKVLFLILDKLGFDWAKSCYHLSYGMVDLPSGKMKSREGTVVDADDLVHEMIATAKEQSQDKGKVDEMSEEEANKLYGTLGLGALKFYILKVDPRKRMLFNPEESIDINGHTGPFIQYSYARIQSLLKKAGKDDLSFESGAINLGDKERTLLKLINEYPEVVSEAGKEYSPALIANFVYELAKDYNQFYQEVPILKEEDQDLMLFRLTLSKMTGTVIQSAMKLMGIDVPEKM